MFHLILFKSIIVYLSLCIKVLQNRVQELVGMVGDQRAIIERIDNNVAQLAAQPAENDYFSRPLMAAIQQNLGVDVNTMQFELPSGVDFRQQHGFNPNNPNLLATRVLGLMLPREQIGQYCGAEAQTVRGAARHIGRRARPPIPAHVLTMIKGKR